MSAEFAYLGCQGLSLLVILSKSTCCIELEKSKHAVAGGTCRHILHCLKSPVPSARRMSHPCTNPSGVSGC